MKSAEVPEPSDFSVTFWKRPGTRISGYIFLCLGIAMSVYVLSIGPLVYLWAKGLVKEPKVLRIYAPFRLAIHNTRIERPFSNYMDWWFRRAMEEREKPNKPGSTEPSTNTSSP